MKRSVFLLPLLAIAALVMFASCSSTAPSTRRVVSLDRYHRIFVEQRLNDNQHLNEVFVAELRRLGRDASSGPMTMLPENTDAVLTYDARWQVDFKTYLVGLNFELHSVHPRKKLADGGYHQPIAQPKSAELIRRMLDELFGTQ